MIVRLQPRHCPALARLHLAHLNTPFCGAPGREMLALYYRAISKGEGAVGYVAIDGEQVQGYVCGVWDASQVQKVLLRSFGISLAFCGAGQIFLRPALLSRVLLRHQSNTSSPEIIKRYELRPIVVAPEARGTGLAADLVTMLLQDAASRGFDRIHLFTEDDNLAANRFYQRFGFEHTKNIIRRGQVYKRYEHTTEGYR